LDEIVTFPRFGLHGAQEVYSVQPDLCTVSKGIANGFPLAALVGTRASMQVLNDGAIFASYTFAGETTALAACQATLEVLETTDALDRLHTAGHQYGDGLQTLLRRHGLPGEVWGHPARLTVKWHASPDIASAEELRTFWIAEHALRQILVGYGVVFPMTCWTDAEVVRLLDTAAEVCRLMSKAIETHTVREHLRCPVIYNSSAVRPA